VIDFRYHLVSIIAVFLALAVGLVIGSTALSGKAEYVLGLAEHRALASNRSLTNKNNDLKNEVSANQAFAEANAQRSIGGLLPHDKVVLVVAPGADSAVTTGVKTALQLAGATVTGEVDLQQPFLDTRAVNETTLTQLAQSLATRAGLAPPTGSQSAVAGQQAVAEVLAASLLDPSAGLTGLSAKASGAILTGLEQNGFVSAASTPAPAAQAVLVAPGGPPPQAGGEVLGAVAAQLSAASAGTVMAGSTESVGAGSIVRIEASSAHAVSTVDNADTEIGQIMVVQALKKLLDGKPAASYGIDTGAAPSPPPTPSPSPSSTSSGAAVKHS
jgi:hypothetical protein